MRSEETGGVSMNGDSFLPHKPSIHGLDRQEALPILL